MVSRTTCKINNFYKKLGPFVTSFLILYTLRKRIVIIFRRLFNYFLSYKYLRIDIDPTSRLIGLEHIDIGCNFHAGLNFWLEAISEYNGVKYNPKIVIKSDVHINDYVHIGATNYVEIGNNVLIASRVFISDHNHGSYSGENQSDPNTTPKKRTLTKNSVVVIGDNVWIGDGVTILPDVKIGDGAIIGANSVVTSDVEEYSIAVGIPARIIKKFCFRNKKWISV